MADGDNGKPLYPATILNLATGQSVHSDQFGNFSLPAAVGETISYSVQGYRTEQKAATPGTDVRIELKHLSVNLPAYVFHELTPFQRDSLELTVLYSKELNKHAVSPGFSSANGGGFTGLIGGPIQKLSKSYKQNQRFKQNFQNDMEQRYIDTRYTPTLVATLTKFSGDSLAYFMNTYPMEYGFARAATDLEIKMWIRANYRDYMHIKQP